MGAYKYVVTTHIVTIDWQEWKDGAWGVIHENERAAIAIYAYKPYSDWFEGKKANREMSRRTVFPWRCQWAKRNAPERPPIVVVGSRDSLTKKVMTAPWERIVKVRGLTFMDDYTPTAGRVVRVRGGVQ